MYKEYPAKLINNHGFWFVECENLGNIDLGDDIPEWLEMMVEINSETQAVPSEQSPNTDYDFGSKKEPQPKGKDASHPSHNH